VLSFDLELLLAAFADPMVPTLNESVVVDSLAVVFPAEITLHEKQFYRADVPQRI
jgi:hypothetical protein